MLTDPFYDLGNFLDSKKLRATLVERYGNFLQARLEKIEEKKNGDKFFYLWDDELQTLPFELKEVYEDNPEVLEHRDLAVEAVLHLLRYMRQLFVG